MHATRVASLTSSTTRYNYVVYHTNGYLNSSEILSIFKSERFDIEFIRKIRDSYYNWTWHPSLVGQEFRWLIYQFQSHSSSLNRVRRFDVVPLIRVCVFIDMRSQRFDLSIQLEWPLYDLLRDCVSVRGEDERMFKESTQTAVVCVLCMSYVPGRRTSQRMAKH